MENTKDMMETSFFRGLLVNIQEKVVECFERDVSCNDQGDCLLTSCVGMEQIYSDKTEKTVKENELITYSIHIVLLNSYL